MTLAWAFRRDRAVPLSKTPFSFSAFLHAAAATMVVAGAVALSGSPASAADDEYALTIKDHKFEPATLEIPAGKRVKLTVTNADDTVEEFESHDFHVEKMVGAGKSISVFVGPLEPGSYEFVGEMHEDTAKGTLTVK